MKIKKKSINVTDGFIRFNNGFEINWCIDDWALPLAIQNTYYSIFIQILFLSFIFPKDKLIENNWGVGWPCSPIRFIIYLSLMLFVLYQIIYYFQ